MNKSEIRQYKSEEEALKKIASFEADWSYNILEYSAMHKTGLKLCLQESTLEYQSVASENFSDWAHHMCHDEKLTGREISMYQRRLLQEFLALSERNSERIAVFNAFWGHGFVSSGKYRS